MASYDARLAAIADALLDGTASEEKKLRAANAYALKYRDEISKIVKTPAEGETPVVYYDADTMSDGEKKAFLVIRIAKEVRTITRQNAPVLVTAKDGVVVAKEAIEAAAVIATEDAEADWPIENL